MCGQWACLARGGTRCLQNKSCQLGAHFHHDMMFLGPAESPSSPQPAASSNFTLVWGHDPPPSLLPWTLFGLPRATSPAPAVPTARLPQGVMLTHSNLLYQVDNMSFFLSVQPGERTLSLLPPWHIYERSCG